MVKPSTSVLLAAKQRLTITPRNTLASQELRDHIVAAAEDTKPTVRLLFSFSFLILSRSFSKVFSASSRIMKPPICKISSLVSGLVFMVAAHGSYGEL
jgi:hypothetical protein